MTANTLGWGGRIRTYDLLIQSQLPYHLATPQWRRRVYPYRWPSLPPGAASAATLTASGMPSASIGVAISGAVNHGASDLLRNADVAMYRAKAAGKNRFVLFEPQMYAAALARMELESDLLHSLEAS